MQHRLTRSEKREERYSTLKAQGENSAMDYLYKSEIKKLENVGYTVDVISGHPTRKNLSLCKVIFPKQG